VAGMLAALEEAGELDDTLVVYTADNGMDFPRGYPNLYDHGARMFLAVRWGRRVPGGRMLDDFVNLVDLAPTFLEAAGVAVPAEMTGRSLVPLLRDPLHPWERPALTTHGQGNHAVRSERWRYIRYADGGEELYDHERDPHEWHNLAASPAHAAVRAEHARWLPRADAPPLGRKARKKAD